MGVGCAGVLIRHPRTMPSSSRALADCALRETRRIRTTRTAFSRPNHTPVEFRLPRQPTQRIATSLLPLTKQKHFNVMVATTLLCILGLLASAAEADHLPPQSRKRRRRQQQTQSPNIVAESAAEEDQKFASEVVAAHIEEATQSEKHKGKKNKVATHMPKPFHCFRTLAGTFDAMHDVVSAYPHLARMADIGNSYRGFDNKVLVLTSSKPYIGAKIEEKGKVFITFGLHARELAPPELGIRFAEHLLESYETDADVGQVLDYSEIHLLLFANPDGRRIVEKDPSLGKEYGWRKNVHDYKGTTCPADGAYDYGRDKITDNGSDTAYVYGVDLNRNFPFMWGESGGSDNPCDDNYRGPSPYVPEPEVAAIIEYAESLFPPEQRRDNGDSNSVFEPFEEDATSGVFIDVHSSGKIVGMPWYFKNMTAPNLWELMALDHKFCSYNGHRPLASGYTYWYDAAGNSIDYMYATFGAASFTFEVGHEQAEDCTYFTKQVLSYNIEALLYAAKVARAPYKIPQGPDVIRLALFQPSEGSPINVEVEVSDEHRTLIKDKRGQPREGYPMIPSGQQSISAVRIFLNQHPYNANGDPSSFVEKKPSLDSPTVRASIPLDISEMSAGRHRICAQAVDTDGYKGAVSCVYFTIDSNGALEKQCLDSNQFFSLLDDKGNWNDRSKTCSDVAKDAKMCDRVVKYRGTAIVADICPLQCDSSCNK